LNDDFLLEKLPWLLCPGRDIWWVEKMKAQEIAFRRNAWWIVGKKNEPFITGC
jgi:hypothetical protein